MEHDIQAPHYEYSSLGCDSAQYGRQFPNNTALHPSGLQSYCNMYQTYYQPLQENNESVILASFLINSCLHV